MFLFVVVILNKIAANVPPLWVCCELRNWVFSTKIEISCERKTSCLHKFRNGAKRLLEVRLCSLGSFFTPLRSIKNTRTDCEWRSSVRVFSLNHYFEISSNVFMLSSGILSIILLYGSIPALIGSFFVIKV